MEMCYDGALVMPSSFVAMDEEEMIYLEGGKYINNESCYAMAFAIGCTASMSTAYIAAMIQAGGAAVLGSLAAGVPVMGWVIAAVGVGYLLSCAKNFASALALSLVHGKGMDVKLGFDWCIPKPVFTAR